MVKSNTIFLKNSMICAGLYQLHLPEQYTGPVLTPLPGIPEINVK